MAREYIEIYALMRTHILPNDARDISPDVIAPSGHIRVMPANYYSATTPEERSLVAVRHGLYGLHTTELVEWVRDRIAGRTALEIGAGNGVLAAALGIRATDNFMQQDPEIRAYYEALRQTPVKYGDRVECLDALDAVRKYRPQVVVACWVTHRYNALQPHREGNMVGVDEVALMQHCDEYIFIGNRGVHGAKPLWDAPGIANEIFRPAGLYSRSMNSDDNFIACFRRT